MYAPFSLKHVRSHTQLCFEGVALGLINVFCIIYMTCWSLRLAHTLRTWELSPWNGWVLSGYLVWFGIQLFGLKKRGEQVTGILLWMTCGALFLFGTVKQCFIFDVTTLCFVGSELWSHPVGTSLLLLLPQAAGGYAVYAEYESTVNSAWQWGAVLFGVQLLFIYMLLWHSFPRLSETEKLYRWKITLFPLYVVIRFVFVPCFLEKFRQEWVCQICMKEAAYGAGLGSHLEVSMLVCGHCIHTKCIHQMRRNKLLQCPFCQVPLRISKWATDCLKD